MPTKIFTRKKIAFATVFLTAAAILLLMSPRQSWKCGAATVTLSRNMNTYTYTVGGNGAMKDYSVYEFMYGGGKLPPYIFTKPSIAGSIFERYSWELIWMIDIVEYALSHFGGITPPNERISFYDNAFYRFVGISAWIKHAVTDLVIEKGVTHIGDWTFDGLNGLTSVTIPGNVESVGEYAFGFCDNLTSVTIEDGVKSIEHGAFLDCGSLKSITVPNSAGVIEYAVKSGAFFGCTTLTSIKVAADNAHYSAEGGVLFNKNKTALILYPQGIKGAYTIPDGVTSIGEKAFSGHRVTNFVEGMMESKGYAGLTSLTISGSVESIGKHAFDGCVNLMSIEAAAGNDRYSSEDGVLFNKDKTVLVRYPPGRQSESYTIPPGVTSIGDEAFSYCHNLITVIIPNGVTSIGDEAFYKSGHTSLKIPKSVTYIGSLIRDSCHYCDLNYEVASITVLNPVPPDAKALSEHAFAWNFCLYVPKNSIDAYRAAEQWKDIECIKPIGADGDS